MKRGLAKLFTLIFLFALISPASASDQPLADPSQEARAVSLGKEFRCVVCQSESINESQADMARDLRQLVRDKIAAGWSDRQVIDYVRARYGDFILLRPPFQTNTYILWASPLLFFGISAGCVFLFLKRRVRKGERNVVLDFVRHSYGLCHWPNRRSPATRKQDFVPFVNHCDSALRPRALLAGGKSGVGQISLHRLHLEA